MNNNVWIDKAYDIFVKSVNRLNFMNDFLIKLNKIRISSLLNIVELSAAFVIFILIMARVHYDLSFDACQINAKSIFRVDVVQNGSAKAIVCRPFAQAFTNSSPHIKAGGVMAAWSMPLSFFVEQEGGKKNYDEKSWNISPEILEVFHFDMVEGDTNSLDDPNSVIIPLSMAEKIWGEKSAMGKLLYLKEDPSLSLVVKGVYTDFPPNSSLINCIYTSMHPKESHADWGNWSYLYFVRLDSHQNKDLVLNGFMKNFDMKPVFGSGLFESTDLVNFRLTSLEKMHYLENVDFDMFPKSSYKTLFMLISIASIILIIAGINFMNFNMALIPAWIKNVTLRKILGCSVAQLRIAFLMKAIGTAFLAYLFSLLLLFIIQSFQISLFMGMDFSISKYLFVVLGTTVMALLVGIMAGLYPAYYITSFPPSIALKGNFGFSPTGRVIRILLIGIQFTVSFILIIGALFVAAQNRYMKNAPLGYYKENIVVVHLNESMNKKRDLFTSLLNQSPDIKKIAYSQFLLLNQDQYMIWGREYKGENINFQCLPVSVTFLETLGIQIESGRSFSPNDELKTTGCYIFNKKAKEKYGLELNTFLEGNEIIGFIPDIKFASFRQEVSPMAFYLPGDSQTQGIDFYNVAYIQLDSNRDIYKNLTYIQEVLSKVDRNQSLDIYPFEQIFQITYKKEIEAMIAIALFSIISLLISLSGVLGIILLENEYRKKEITIRKVFGATTGEILLYYNIKYLKIVLVCFAIGAPIAWYFITQWLANFAYRVPMSGAAFFFTFCVVVLLIIVIVTSLCWQSANDNPIRNIKSE